MALSYFTAAGYWWWTGTRAERKTLPPGALFFGATLTLSYFDEEKWVAGHHAAAGHIKAVGIVLLVTGILSLLLDEDSLGWLFAVTALPALVLLVAAEWKAHATVRNMS